MSSRHSMETLGLDMVTELCMLDRAIPPPFSFEGNLGVAIPKSVVQIAPTSAYDTNYWGGPTL